MNKNESLYKKQKAIRPKLEDVLNQYLDGEIRQNALNFVAWLRANKMPPQWGSANSWSVSYKKIRVCYIKLENESWYICPSQYRNGNEYFNDFISNNNLKELVWASLKPCQNCLSCSPGINLTVSGREFNNICGWYSIRFCDLGAEELEDVKEVINSRNLRRE